MPLVAVGLKFGPVGLSGRVCATGEQSIVAPVQADTLGQPRPGLTFRFCPTLSFWGFPVSFELRLETIRGVLRKPFDLLGLSVDPSLLKLKLPSLGWLAGSLKGFELGSCSPKWTPLTLSGATIWGGAIELDPGPFYAAAAVGQARHAVEGRDFTGLPDSLAHAPDSVTPSYQRMLYAGRLGCGKKEDSHFYLTGMYVYDDPLSIRHSWYNRTTGRFDCSTPADCSARVEVRPAENYVGGAELNLSLLDGRVRLESELAGAVLTPDNRLPKVCSGSELDIYEDVFRPNASTLADYSFRVRPSLGLPGVSVYGEVGRVGARHFSLGAPELRTGLFTFGAGFDAELSRGQVSVSASYEHEDDSPSVLKAQMTTFHSGSAGLGLSFAGLPFFRLGYSPRFLRSASSKEDRHDATLGAGYRFRTGAVCHSPGLSTTWQHNSSSGSGSTEADVTLSHSLGFSFPLSLAVSAGYGWQKTGGDFRPRYQASVSPSCTAFRVWKNTLTYRLQTETGGANHTVGLVTTFPVWKLADANLSVKQKFSRDENGSLHELKLGGGLSTSW
ncbi:MAG: hypothetical protein JSU73_12175 [candidate division WOR-3 bacterium]|nr:MAG: hypothetical protein JSU73_12175 [candidate division WOR-3 bacterium]